jgi:hypothetical protein
MRFPFSNPHFAAPFTKLQLDDWMELYRPISIEMDDRQYAHLAAIAGSNVKEYKGIPIHFMNGPRS